MKLNIFLILCSIIVTRIGSAQDIDLGQPVSKHEDEAEIIYSCSGANFDIIKNWELGRDSDFLSNHELIQIAKTQAEKIVQNMEFVSIGSFAWRKLDIGWMVEFHFYFRDKPHPADQLLVKDGVKIITIQILPNGGSVRRRNEVIKNKK